MRANVLVTSLTLARRLRSYLQGPGSSSVGGLESSALTAEPERSEDHIEHHWTSSVVVMKPDTNTNNHDTEHFCY